MLPTRKINCGVIFLALVLVSTATARPTLHLARGLSIPGGENAPSAQDFQTAEKSEGDPVFLDESLAAGAAYLRTLQADITEDNAGNGIDGQDENPDDPDDGGWDWALWSPDFLHSVNPSHPGIYGTCGKGLCHAHERSGGSELVTAMGDAITAIMNDPAKDGAPELSFLIHYDDLPEITGTLYQDAAKDRFDTILSGYASATAMAESIRDAWATGGNPNGIIAWDLGAWVVIASLLAERYPGDPLDYDQVADDIAEVLWQDSFNDNPGHFDILDAQGFDPGYAVPDFLFYNLGISGLIDAFRASGTHTGDLPGLAAILFESQHPNGAIGFSYGLHTGDQDWQSTTYSSESLGLFDQATYQPEISKMAYFLAANQHATGGWVRQNGRHLPTETGENLLGVRFGTSPTISGLQIQNLDLGHTDEFVKDGDSVLVEAVIADATSGFGIASVTADLSGLGSGSAEPPIFFDPGTGQAVWSVLSVITTPADGEVVVTVTAIDNFNLASRSTDSILADNTPPSPLTGFTANPGHQMTELIWDDATANDSYFAGVVIRYARWSSYPEFPPPGPDFPAGPLDGEGDAYIGIGTSATHDLTGQDRDIYVYGGLVFDEARNYSPLHGTGGSQDSSTNYWLGDVSDVFTGYGFYDGYVDVADYSAIGSSYGLVDGDPSFRNECDIGPTDDATGTGIPQPDDMVDFDDLMIAAQNYDLASPAVPSPGGKQAPELAWLETDEGSWALYLLEPCDGLKGLRVVGKFSPGSVRVSAGELLDSQTRPVFLMNIDRRGLDTGLVVMGHGAGLAGSGEILRLTLPTGASLADISLEARGLRNETIYLNAPVTDNAPDQPLLLLSQNQPNPFNPETVISFNLPATQNAKLVIYSLAGQRIATLVDGILPQGRHDVSWRGQDDNGRLVASGNYIYRIETGTLTLARKMTLMK